jgi:hypothetical protein
MIGGLDAVLKRDDVRRAGRVAVYVSKKIWLAVNDFALIVGWLVTVALACTVVFVVVTHDQRVKSRQAVEASSSLPGIVTETPPPTITDTPVELHCAEVIRQ